MLFSVELPVLKNNLGALFAVSLLAGTALRSAAQEYREPTETTEVVITSTYPVSAVAAIGADGLLYVWVDYSNVYVTDKKTGYHRAGFAAARLRKYAGTRLVSETTQLKLMPDPLSIDKQSWLLKGVTSGHIGEDGDDKIVVYGQPENSLKGLGFIADRVVLGPFKYRVSSAWPIGLAGGYLYVNAYCSAPGPKSERGGDMAPFGALYVLNKELLIVDSFVYHKEPGPGPHELLPDTDGRIFLAKNGNFYSVEVGEPAQNVKVKVKKWTPRGLELETLDR